MLIAILQNKYYFMLTVQIRKLRHENLIYLTQGHTTNKWQETLLFSC